MSVPFGAPPLLEVKGLVKRYDGRTVLAGVDLAVERGETVVVLGASGSGKSTFARVLIGLEEPTAGRILLDGNDLAALSTRDLEKARHRFAMVFQRYALLDSLSVFDNVAFPLEELRSLSQRQIRERVMAMLESLGIADAAGQLPGELSGGMAKRVGVARAMVMAPEILIYDEPTSGLDPLTSRVVDELIEEVRERFCVTSIVITHDMATAYGIADRIVLLDGGRLVMDATPHEVFAMADPRIHQFASSSGVEPSRLVLHAHRKTPAEIRALWAERHPLPRSP